MFRDCVWCCTDGSTNLQLTTMCLSGPGGAVNVFARYIGLRFGGVPGQ